MMTPKDRAEEQRQLRRMRGVSLLEGTTLLLLVMIAVPLKHLAGLPVATAIMGPIHGMAFLLYVWMLIQTVSGGGWSRSETCRMVVAAFIPFGAFLNERRLARRQAALAASA
jgi:integral membrane protein